MKQSFAVMFAVVFLAAAFSSCKKCYTCSYYRTATQVYCTKDNSAAQLNIYDTLCVQSGGIWTPYEK